MKEITPSEKWTQFITNHRFGKTKVRINERRWIRIKQEQETEELKDPEQVFWKKKHMKFLTSASKEEQIPNPTLPEICFVGRSNVGKGSLINALTSRGVVVTSERPGETQTLNWFQLSNRLNVVDMPGYGFAFASEDKISDWTKLIHTYLLRRGPILRRILVLIDSRVGIKNSDRELMTLLTENSGETKAKWQVVLTKTDLLVPPKLAHVATAVEQIISKDFGNENPILMSSAVGHQRGIALLRKELIRWANPPSEKSVAPKKKQKPMSPSQKAKMGASPELAEEEEESLQKKRLLTESKKLALQQKITPFFAQPNSLTKERTNRSFDRKERTDQSFDRKEHTDRSFDRKERTDRSLDRKERTDRSFDRKERTDRPFDRKDRTDRPFDRKERTDRSFDRKERTDRPFDRKERGRSFDRKEHTDRSFDRKERTDRSFDRKEHTNRSFDRKERTERSFDRKERTDRSFDRKERTERSFDRKERTDRSFDRKERTDRSFDRKERTERSFDRKERTDRSFDRKERTDKNLRKNRTPSPSLFKNRAPRF